MRLSEVAHIGVASVQALKPSCKIDGCPGEQDVEVVLCNGEGRLKVCRTCADALLRLNACGVEIQRRERSDG